MNDTDKSIENKFFEMIMKKSGEERIKMGLEMFGFTEKSIIASILHDNSGVSITEMKIEILKRCYGDAITSGVEQGFRKKVSKVLDYGGKIKGTAIKNKLLLKEGCPNDNKLL